MSQDAAVVNEMVKILITGGPVEAKLDSVKVITNRFKGGRMAQLADLLAVKTASEVTYLCSKNSKQPEHANIVHFDGFEDYMEKVIRLSTQNDAVVLGAAVANLIPDEHWRRITLKDGKFPSHNYQEGDPVPVLLRIAPRVINAVKKVAPRTVLIGYKLLSGVDRDTLVRAAQETLYGANADLVIANDSECLDGKIFVTPEGGAFDGEEGDVWKIVYEMAADRYYQSQAASDLLRNEQDLLSLEHFSSFQSLVQNHEDLLLMGRQKNGMIYGCVALRINDNRFLISSRGKRNLSDHAIVNSVDHREKIVFYGGYYGKASLNAPLVDKLFKRFPDAVAVVHWHEPVGFEGEQYEYAPPGTARDTDREFGEHVDSYMDARGNAVAKFAIRGHGYYEVLRAI